MTLSFVSVLASLEGAVHPPTGPGNGPRRPRGRERFKRLQRDRPLSANRPRQERTRRSARLTGCCPRGGGCPLEPLLRVEVVERVSNRPCCVVRLYHRVRARRRLALGLSGARVFHGLFGALSRTQENVCGTADDWYPPRHPAQRRRTRLDSERCLLHRRPSTPGSASSSWRPRFRQLRLQLAADLVPNGGTPRRFRAPSTRLSRGGSPTA